MQPTLTCSGVGVQELLNGMRTIVGLATSITTFVGQAWRGPVEEPTTAFSFSEFQRQFGGLWRDGTLRYAVQQFFSDGGGQVVILRLASNAKLVRLDLGNGTTLLAANAGTWGDNLTALVDYNHDTGNTTDTKQFNLTLIDDATVKDDALDWGGSRVTECLLNVLVDPRSPRCLANVLKQHSTLATAQAVGAQRPPETTGSQPTAVKVNVDGNDGNELGDGDFVPTTGSALGLQTLDKVLLFDLLCLPPLTAGDSGKEIGIGTWGAAADLCLKRREFLLVDAPAGWKASPRHRVRCKPLGQFPELAAAQRLSILCCAWQGLLKFVRPSVEFLHSALYICICRVASLVFILRDHHVRA